MLLKSYVEHLAPPSVQPVNSLLCIDVTRWQPGLMIDIRDLGVQIKTSSKHGG